MISALREDALTDSMAGGAPPVVRKAAMRDIQPILDLINGYAAQGLMLPRTEFELSEAIRDFSVAERGGKLLGCGALHFYTPTLGEIRSLAVHPDAKTKGVGRRLVSSLVREAQENELDAVFAFTYVVNFFRKAGFEEVDRGALPLKAWKDCLRCPKFQACDEIAVLRVLRPQHWLTAQTLQWSPAAPEDALIQIPTKA
ncbi:MAG TPA: N-acetyltransferase [Bryobacteraceae bacterium]|nr:N-acetyltransferase [Bryobacteraceae bacterium]